MRAMKKIAVKAAGVVAALGAAGVLLVLAGLELVLGIYESAASGKPVRFPLSRGSTMDYVGRFDR